MADTLNIFGTEYTGVAGIIATTPSDTDLTYIRPQGTKSISANGTGIDVAEYATVSVAVPDNTLVVTLSYNSTSEMWEPNKTYAEIYNAYHAGKDIVTVTAYPEDLRTSCLYDGTFDRLIYWVSNHDIDPSGTDNTTYLLTSNGLEIDETWVDYNTGEATISSNGQLLNGIKAVGSDGTLYTGNIPTKTSGDLTVSGATVTVPSGYYSAQASKAVESGTAGTPTATKGTVSNHSVTVTPSVTNTTGYITGSTKTGTAVTVSASELVSGTYTVDSSGTKDVTNYASASVPAGTAGTPSASKGAVSNHSVSVTPSVTNTTGWITGSTKTGTAVTVSASELVSGTYSVSASGTHDVTNYASASVPSGSATASATKGTVSNHSVIVTPSVTRTAGYITAGSANGTAVTVSASELVSGSQTITDNGTTDVTTLASVTVAIPFVTYYTGTSDPASSLGSNGDIYLKVVS